MEELKKMMKLEKEIEKMDKSLEEETAQKRAEFKKVQAELAEMEEPFKEVIRINKEMIAEIRFNLLVSWNDEWGKQFTDEETNIMLTRKVRATPEVHDEKALLTQAVTFDELPIKKISWDNSKLKALISAGIIKKNTATLIENYELAVTYPKKE